MKKEKWMRVIDFEEKYGLSKGHVHVARGKVFPKSVMKKMDKTTYINENYFIRRSKFKSKIWNQNHDLYFFLSKHLGLTELSKMLHSITDSSSWSCWSSFILCGMWTPINESILDYRITKYHYMFNKGSKTVARQLFRKLNIPVQNRNVSILLDKEMNNEN